MRKQLALPRKYVALAVPPKVSRPLQPFQHMKRYNGGAEVPSKVTACLVLGSLIYLGAPVLLSQSASAAPSTPPDNMASSQNVSHVPPPGFQDRYPRYQLVPGDTMDLVFEFSPEFNQSVSVQPDGYISLRGAGDVHVSSMTLPQLISTLEVAYGKILNKPAISVVLKDYEKPYFIATGQ